MMKQQSQAAAGPQTPFASAVAPGDSPEPWSVPPGSERRVFLTVWYAICTWSGMQLMHQSYQAWEQDHKSLGRLALFISEVIYVALYASLVLITGLRPRLYRRYKIFWDLLHLYYCHICHILNVIWPMSGAPITPTFSVIHLCLTIGTSVLGFNLPVWCWGNLYVMSLPCHLLIHHFAFKHHVGLEVGVAAYVRSAARLPIAPVLVLLPMLFVCEIDGAADILAAQTHDAAGRPVPAWRRAARKALARYAALQTVCQPFGPAIVSFFCGIVLIHGTCSGLVTAMTGVGQVCVHPITQLHYLIAAYILGSNNLWTTVKPQLNSAFNLLHDLIPAHVAHALLRLDEEEKEAHTRAVVARHVPPHRKSSASASVQLPASSSRLSHSGSQTAGSRTPTTGQVMGLGAAADAAIKEVASAEPGMPSGVQTPEQALGSVGVVRQALSRVAGDPGPLSSGGPATALSLLSTDDQPLDKEASGLMDVGHEPPSTRRGRMRRTSMAGGMMSQLLSLVTGEADHEGTALQQVGNDPLLLPHASLQAANVGPALAEWHESASILFSDIVGFTDCSRQVAPGEVMAMLNELYHRYDDLCMAGSKVYKVETIGDCYMAATGLMAPDPAHALHMVEFALALQREAAQVMMPHNGQPVKIRIGIHSGRVMSGVVGRIRKRYCLFGDTVNTASRMESNSEEGRIHVSSATYELVAGSSEGSKFEWECRGQVPIKGKGLMTTYFLAGTH